MPDAAIYEKLGAFYLGRHLELTPSGEARATDEPVLYDAKDLTTHGVCLGMTGSGKTGLCITLLEEAALDGIPAIAIDPKGDLGNLLLTFPDLAPKSFRPWIDEGEAARAGRTPDEHARAMAELWRKGLAGDGQDPARIQRLRDAVETTIYTPGSDAGRQLTVLRSFDAPPAALRSDGDAMRERVQSAVSGLLTLLGIDADPLKSREHILLSNVVEQAWMAGRSLDLPSLIREVQSPPFDSVGVFDLETFFPAGDRMGLAMTLNNVLASPSFGAWREGEPLDIARLLYTESGKPRLSIVSIAHLSESERMFFVTLLLSELVAWMRTQPGTRSLRALLYMDEVFGYLPPTANPPSKVPLLTLLKQARAYGLGCMLATQNPVDLDYKALSNTGTWLLGRLQTERDKARVLDGLEGAASATGGGFDRQRMDALLAGLGSRQFLLHNVHEDEPILIQSRFALSYLRGPLTRAQIERLTQESDARAEPRTEPAPSPALAVPDAAKAPAAAAAAAEEEAEKPARPVLPAAVDEAFALPRGARPSGVRLHYRPTLVAAVHLHYAQARAQVDHWETVAFQVTLEQDPSGSPWDEGGEIDWSRLDLVEDPEDDSGFAELCGSGRLAKSYPRWGKMIKAHVYRERPLRLFKCRELKLVAEPGEQEGDFRVRVRQALREKRDLAIEKLRKRHAPKLARLQERIRKADARIEKEREQYEAKKRDTLISVGATVIGALFGRKLASARTVGRATTTARGAQRAMRERGDIERAEETAEALREELESLEARFAEDTAEVEAEIDDAGIELEEVVVRPRKTDVEVERLALVWMPWWKKSDGGLIPGFE
ncbi:MAG: DUF87 domain-containing protein [Myxococcota bacterium]|nr:DUF87 domain-containing protein [Myxococcota bacterium]